MAQQETRAEEESHNHHTKFMPEPEEKQQLRDPRWGVPRWAPPPGHGGYALRDGRRSAVCTIVIILVAFAGITALTLWLLYRPHKPRFTVVSAALFGLNTTSPPFISTTMQFTLLTRNPNKRVLIYYDQLSGYVSYKNQAITQTANLPPLIHGTKSTLSLSPVVGGLPVLVPAEVVNGLVMDEDYGAVGLRLVLMGRMRYRAGIITSGTHVMYVKCDMFVGLKKGCVGQLPLLGGSSSCRVDV